MALFVKRFTWIFILEVLLIFIIILLLLPFLGNELNANSFYDIILLIIFVISFVAAHLIGKHWKGEKIYGIIPSKPKPIIEPKKIKLFGREVYARSFMIFIFFFAIFLIFLGLTFMVGYTGYACLYSQKYYCNVVIVGFFISLLSALLFLIKAFFGKKGIGVVDKMTSYLIR